MSAEFGQSEGFILSSDCVGRFGSPKEIEKVWDFALTEKKFLGVEVVGWKNIINSFNKLLEKRVKIAGIHGRMGTDKTQPIRAKVRAAIVDSNIVGTKELLEKASEVPYLLLHSVCLNKAENKELLLEKKSEIRTLLIENHVQKDALIHALKHAVSLREKGVNAGLMIDIVHYFYENKVDPTRISAEWGEMLFWVNRIIASAKAADTAMPIGIHLPVGTNANDSLLMDHLTNAQWKKLADVIHNEANIPIVLENQQADIGLLFLTAEDALTQKHRNEDTFKLLTENGVI
ncbi:hypothetical protein HY502_01685 [Candidatus Woesebacteria bacterium]|nr:hypothetical protein [Candidatus Woesebacteria bacterium]